jgi:DNA-directed RNA polymerase II subunit RPB1
MSLYKELSYDNDVDSIKGIQFCIMSPEEIQKRSVAEIFKTDTYNGNDPVLHGLFDPRMGVIDHNKVCPTCEQRNTFCPGHFGHINLAKPVFYVQFFGMVKNLLKCVCFRCSKLLVDPDSDEVKALMQKKISRQKRWEAVYKLCQRAKRCGQFTVEGCGAKQPTIFKEGMLKIGFEWRESVATEGEVKKQILGAEDVLRILRRISDRDAEVLGFSKKYNRPEYMICTALPVPPPSVRPSVRNDTGVRSEDDLTHKLSMIIKDNNNLKQKIEKGAKDQIDMLTMLLQYDVATLIDNTIPGIPQAQQRTGRPIRSLTERLKGKEGRIRGNLMGKRVDFSARSVITPDPNISIDELGVPIKIAMNLTTPEIVHVFNKDEMYKLVRNGPDVYPGAKFVRKTREGRTIRLRNIDRSSIVLEEGDVVERHLRNGDSVLFNRQPSLHRMSMMAHRVRVMPYNTFRLNVMVTPSFNADFDGDEI